MLSNVFTHRSTGGISLAQFLQSERRAHGKMAFVYHLPCSSSLAELGPCFGAGEYPTIPESGCNHPDLVSGLFASSVLLWRSLAQLWRRNIQRLSWGVLVHLLSPAQGLYSAPQGDAGSIKASFHQHRSREIISNSRISFYSTPQSILTSFRQGECCCYCECSAQKVH